MCWYWFKVQVKAVKAVIESLDNQQLKVKICQDEVEGPKGYQEDRTDGPVERSWKKINRLSPLGGTVFLSENYIQKVRNGAALALRIACARIGMEEAIRPLGPMTRVTVGYDRNGGCIALAMIPIQQNKILNPRSD
ncbi:hypothetical protein BY996DRAFT_6415205 [Phakopsora pachyrhizi]|nr:hypothetical protein BY996DRAFT_6415205 [Phakopsora pachyrhizi]